MGTKYKVQAQSTSKIPAETASMFELAIHNNQKDSTASKPRLSRPRMLGNEMALIPASELTEKVFPGRGQARGKNRNHFGRSDRMVD